MAQLVPQAPPAAAPPADLLERAAGYAQRAWAPATLKGYAADWRDFSAWCAAQQLAALPAEPATVAAYLTDHAGRRAVATLRRRLTAISQYHQAAGHPSPTATFEVRRVWRGIARTHARPARQAEPAVTQTIRAMVDTLDDSLAGRRDRALLLIGFAGFLRRSELGALDLADVTEVPEGLEVLVRRSQTDQHGKGHVQPIPHGDHAATCPVRAWRAWTHAAALTHGPVFREVDRHGNLGSAPLSGRAVAKIIKRVAAAAGLDPTAFSGHSLRAGLAVAAAAAGVPQELIREQGRWRKAADVRPYVRKGARWRDVVAAQVGL